MEEETDNPERSWTISELSERWGCAAKTIYKKVYEGSLHPFSLAEPGAPRQNYRFTEEEVKRFEGRKPASKPTTAVSRAKRKARKGNP